MVPGENRKDINMKRIAMNLIASLCLVASPHAVGDDAHHKKDAGLTAGVVKKIDRDAGKISIAHDPIENLGMPKMTMVFRVKDPVMLEAVKEGDKVNFAADNIQGALTVTRIEGVK
jgi:Cu/Ag efflux protein CusF